ncbi:MAG: hypothetical protein ACRDE2_00180 [Chitinophagaceae bacterium]
MTTIINNYIPYFSEIFYKNGNPTNLINSLQNSGSIFYLCPGSICYRIIFDNKLFIYNLKTDDFPPQSAFLFSAVKKDVINYIEHNNINVFNKYPCIFETDKTLPDSEYCGTDINRAYWTIARNSGLIRQETFEKGLSFKQTSLAALSSMGRSKTFTKFRGKERLGCWETEINGKLIEGYEFIRNTCFSYMNEIKEAIPGQFIKWKTDEVMYSYSDWAVNKVHEILTSKNLTFKDRLIKII